MCLGVTILKPGLSRPVGGWKICSTTGLQKTAKSHVASKFQIMLIMTLFLQPFKCLVYNKRRFKMVGKVENKLMQK
jgi:hypothetical protein